MADGAADADAGAGAAPEGGAPQSLFSRRRVRVVYLIAVSVLLLLLAYRLREALNPFLLSCLIAYMLNPVVGWLVRRVHLPRTVAIVLAYVVAVGGVAALGIYAVGKTVSGFDRAVVKFAGGWQYAPPGVAPQVPEGTTITARIPGIPVYGDDEIRPSPHSPMVGWIDLNQNGAQDAAEPRFSRETGRWRPIKEYASVVRRVPGYLDGIGERVKRYLPEQLHLDEMGERIQTGAGLFVSAATQLWEGLAGVFFGGLASVLLYAVLVPVYTFFLLRGFDDIVERVRSLLPGLHRARVESIVRRIDRACAAFFRGRFIVCMMKGLVTWIGLRLVGVEFALPIGIIAGALSIVPAIGPLTGMLLAVVASYTPDGGWLARILWSGGVFFAAEVAEGVANPVILGREVGLHPVTLLIALFLFGDLFGLFGVLLAVPLAAIAKILGQEFILPELEHLAAERHTPESGKLSGIFTFFGEGERKGSKRVDS